VLGGEDGEPKTPAWASEKCGVPEWTIKALARDWAKKTASILHGNGGGLIRGPYATEPARLEALLLGMRGVGKPGVHQAKLIEFNLWNRDFPLPYQGDFMPALPSIADPLRPVDGDVHPSINMKRFTLNPEQQKRAPELIELFKQHPAPKQFIPRCLIHRAIIDGHAEWYGLQCFSSSQIPDSKNFRQSTSEYEFEKMAYPRPGLSRIHMLWTDAPCNTTCWNDGNLAIESMRHESIECIVAQHPWLENDCYFADIILPVATKHELNDIANDLSSGAYVSIYKADRSSAVVGESLSDFDVCARVAEKLGKDVYDMYTCNLSEDERVRYFYKASGCEDYMTWEEFTKQKIFIVPCKEGAIDLPPGLREFYEDPENHPLTTPSGLIEFSSKHIEQYMPDDPERPPVPHWIESGESHDERRSSERAKKYPLLLMSNHGRWRMHAQCDDIVWNREVQTMKVRGADGYQYEPCWLNPGEADRRGIAHGDVVKVFNERGIVLCGAYVTERVTEGVCYVDHGSRLDPIIPGLLDRGGAINTITPAAITSKHATGMATSGFLAEVQRVTDAEMSAWRRDYPEAFARRVDEAQGVCLDGWLL
ncbi:MAG: dehydrogenase, partial [Oscillospiraceae bacterium]|jgi:trimethylamine-N-oxide reductase (cytochrome c)|nr:dehydrogenase [Oscillospiraceae bacterium]